MSRLNYLSQIKDFLLDMLSTFCSDGWKIISSTDKRNDITTSRYVLTTLAYPCFFSLYQLFYINGKRTLTVDNLAHLDLLGVAVMIMITGYRIEMMYRLSAYIYRQRAMPGYVDGLVINLGSSFTPDERELLKNRLTDLGLTVDLTYTMRRTYRKSLVQELVIPTADLPAALNLLKPYLLSDCLHLFENNV